MGCDGLLVCICFLSFDNRNEWHKQITFVYLSATSNKLLILHIMPPRNQLVTTSSKLSSNTIYLLIILPTMTSSLA